MTRLKLFLLILSLAFAPVVFAPQWLGALSWWSFRYTARSAYATPGWLIVVREGLPIAFIAAVALSQRSFWQHRAMLPAAALVGLLGVSLAILALSDLRVVLMPAALSAFVRNVVFFALPVAVYAFLSRAPGLAYRRIVLRLLTAVLMLNVCVSVAQTFWGLPVEMTTFFGPRAVGISTNPNTAGTLTGIGALLLLFDYRPRWFWPILYVIFACGAILTGSRTGIVGTLLVGMIAAWSSRKPGRFALVPLALVVVPIVFLNLSFLSGRAATIDAMGGIAGDPRVELFTRPIGQMSVAELVAGRGLGFATNLGFRMAAEQQGAASIVTQPDSIVTKTILQFGLLGAALFFLAAAGFFMAFVPPRARLVSLIFLVIYGGVTANIIETYPAGLLFGVLLGCLAAESRAPG